MLPDEATIREQIAIQFRTEFQAMADLHDAVVGMFDHDWTVPPDKMKGIDPAVVYTVAGLLTKASKTFRGVQLLCEAGLGTDAGALARSLFETTVAVMFILKARAKDRARIYHAHATAQNIKILEHWKRTPGLKRKATARMFTMQRNDLARWMQMLPAATNVKAHWSGKSSFEQAVKTLKGDVSYAIFYRHTSTFAHASDFREHVDWDPATHNLIFKLQPSHDHVDGQALVARVMLWTAAMRINERLGLGFDATLQAQKPLRMK